MSTDAIRDSAESKLAIGLTAAEVAERIACGQSNRLPGSGWAEYRAIIVRNVITLFNLLVVPAAIALLLLGEDRAAWAVSAMALFNTLIGVVQEIRAKRHLDKLAILADPKARVRRDGRELVIPASEVVRGEHILLASGDTIIADGVLLLARYLEVDESLLTGESDPVLRQPGDRLLSGSYCVAGDGVYQVDKVGAESFANQTSAQARRYHFIPSPMQRIVDKLIRVLTATAIGLCVSYVGLYYTRGFERAELWEMIAATVTSMVPQGLVLMTTLAFTLGALRLSAQGAVVQRLSAVESMASVTDLCMDKTGTLTTGQLSLDGARALEGSAEDARSRLRLFAWMSIDEGNRSIQAIRHELGEPAERGQLLDQLPFRSQNRYSAVRVRLGDAEHALVLGGFEALRPFVLEADLARAEALWRELLPTGLRLLLFAEARHPEGAVPFGISLQGYTLTPIALVTFSDELRPEAGHVLSALAAQGIRFKILSGDNPETVRALIEHLPLPLAHEGVVSGVELDGVSERAEIIKSHSVFGRVTPQQKLEIIRLLQAQGSHVAMIGDGINDILAIKRADLGIAMGAGSSATKTVAGLVLENNNFDLLPITLAEGRTIVRNLRRSSKLFLLKNVYTLFLIVMALGVLRLKFPYLPQQVTLLNALTIGGPAFLIMLSRGGLDSDRPRVGFLKEVGWFALGSGLVMGAAGLAAWVISAWAGDDEPTQRTILLSSLILLGLGNLLMIAERDWHLIVWSIVASIVYGCAVYFPPTAYFFELVNLSLSQWRHHLSTCFPGKGTGCLE